MIQLGNLNTWDMYNKDECTIYVFDIYANKTNMALTLHTIKEVESNDQIIFSSDNLSMMWEASFYDDNKIRIFACYHNSISILSSVMFDSFNKFIKLNRLITRVYCKSGIERNYVINPRKFNATIVRNIPLGLDYIEFIRQFNEINK